ncbi:hypothetical protein VTI74DRAFT_7231 [Chaetomium olivicolor]
MMADFTKTPRPFYPPLSSHKREIRLLHLEPGTGTEHVQCRLRVVSLHSKPSYEALSYCWGQRTSKVFVDGHRVTIPANLHDALRRFRHASQERILWADAICIDQSQVEERNAQVALMADIYKKCDKCLIWMGEVTEFSAKDYAENFPELLAALAKKHHLDQPGAPFIHRGLGMTQVPLMFLNAAAWWSRIWVVQEVILAPRSLLFYGSLEMDFSDLVRAAEFIDEHDIGSAWGATRQGTDDLCHCMDWIKVTFIWEDMLILRDHVFRLLDLSRSPDPAKGGNSSSPDIVDVLLNVRLRQCTDPRDKIFGVLSLVKNWSRWKPIEADYSKNTLRVFRDFAAQMLQSEYGANALLLARGLESRSKELLGLPSWMPDWSENGSPYDKYLITLARESSRHPQQTPISILGPILHLPRVHSLGKITSLSAPGAPIHKTHGQPTTGEDYQRFTAMLDAWRTFAGVSHRITLGSVLSQHITPAELALLERPLSTRVWPDPVPIPFGESGSFARLMSDLERSHETVDFMPYILDFWMA